MSEDKTWSMIWTDELEELKSSIQRVRKLHQKHKYVSFGDVGLECKCCEKDYPCATIKALGSDTNE
jgi:hypothetical protein